MIPKPLEQLVVLFAFLLAFLCFVVQMVQGSTLLYSAFVACCVVLGASIVLLYLVRFVATIMARYLRQQQEEENESAESHQLGEESNSQRENE